MTTALYTTVTASSAISCYSCGTAFWMTTELERTRREDHRDFYCPNGHSQHWPQETEAEKLKRQLRSAQDSAARARAEADQAVASRRAFKGQVTKLRRKIAEGSCPFCGDKVPQLQWHIEEVHKGEDLLTVSEEPL